MQGEQVQRRKRCDQGGESPPSFASIKLTGTDKKSHDSKKEEWSKSS